MRKHTLKDIHTYALKYYIKMWVWIYSISTSTVWVHGVHIYWCMGESPKKTLPHCWMAKNMINDGELVSWFQNLFLSSLTLSMHPGVHCILCKYGHTFTCIVCEWSHINTLSKHGLSLPEVQIIIVCGNIGV